MASKKLRIAFIHPDLGLGGAERLIVDAACGLKKADHHVTMFTTHHEPGRCFTETQDGTLSVHVYGDYFPRTLFNKFHILFSTIRMLWCTLMVCLWWKCFDVIVVDQVSTVIPLIRFFSLLFCRNTKVIFYCHFPDKLLSVHNQDSSAAKKWLSPRGSMSLKPANKQREQPASNGGLLALTGVKRLYRHLFDLLEEYTTGMAHVIMVNSKFTANVFKDAFPSIHDAKLHVLYPPINCELYDKRPNESNCKPKSDLVEALNGKKGIVSINRFERKKGIALAVAAFAQLKQKLPESEFKKLVLILAGGYDARLQENIDYVAELKELAAKHQIENQTLFLCSFNEADRYVLLHEAQILLYTPENEHFGIVPVEAMFCERCVIAVNSGGPLESIVHQKTGLLVDPEPESFADAMIYFLHQSNEENEKYGRVCIIYCYL